MTSPLSVFGPGTSDGTAPSPRLLVVEDEQKVAGALREGLEGEGYTVVVGGTGEGALSRIATEHDRFDTVVLDLTLPGCDGRSTLITKQTDSHSARCRVRPQGGPWMSWLRVPRTLRARLTLWHVSVVVLVLGLYAAVALFLATSTWGCRSRGGRLKRTMGS